ncbi:MAG: ABC transporter permease subunit [Planctomycetota bacterium]
MPEVHDADIPPAAPGKRGASGRLLIRRPISRPLYLTIAVASVVLLFFAYTLFSMAKKAENPRDRTVPSWSQLAEGVGETLRANKRGEVMLVDDGLATAGRFATGFATAIALGIVIGIGMGCLAVVEAALLPAISFLARIPPTALLAIMFILFGLGLGYTTATIAIGVTPVLAQTVFSAVREDVPQSLIFKARTLGASQAEIVWDVIVPTVLPRMIDAARLQVGPALVFLIAAEYANAQEGFGYQIRIQARLTGMNIIMFYCLLLGIGGFVLDLLLRKTRQVVSPWYGVKQ